MTNMTPPPGPSRTTLGTKPFHNATIPSSRATRAIAVCAHGTRYPATAACDWMRDLTTSHGVLNAVLNVALIVPTEKSSKLVYVTESLLAAFMRFTTAKSRKYPMRPKYVPDQIAWRHRVDSAPRQNPATPCSGVLPEAFDWYN